MALPSAKIHFSMWQDVGRLRKQVLYGRNVTSGEINHVNVITTARAIARFVVVSEYLNHVAHACCGLSNKGKEVVWRSDWTFPYKPRRMRPNRIEVTQ